MDDENILKLGSGDIIQLSKYIKNYCITHLKTMDFIICKLYLYINYIFRNTAIKDDYI